MENPQMGMPAEMAPQGPSPEEMAIFDQMRQQISPQEFSNEMLAGASQVDPQAVAEFTQELQGLDMPPEVLDALNDVVDEILANPDRYDELRAQYMEQGLPEDILPEQFDPNFFAALNMAIDQMIAAPTGVQAFAEGGIAELKPIAKAIASYGRNGDTMLAHITPAEARMLRRRGGSGTTNPDTGLPEFFLKKLFKGIGKALKSIGNAVKKFANSTVGRLVTTVALGFFLGPAAASFMGVSSVAGVAAVSGFVGSAGSTLLGGGNLKDALKAGAIGGLTAGAGAGIMGGSGAFASGSYAGPTTIGGQFDAFKSATGIGAAPVVDAPAAVPGLNQAGAAPVPGADVTVGSPMVDSPNLSQTGQNLFDSPTSEFAPKKVDITNTGNIQQASTPGGTVTQSGPPVDATEFQGSLAKNAGTGQPPSLVDQTKEFYNKNISPSGIQEAGIPAAQDAGAKAVNNLLARVPTATPAMQEAAYQVAYKAAMPGMLSTYGPMAAVGLGTMAAFGGFESKPVQGGEITQSLMKPVTQRIAEDGTQRQMYLQGMPGVQYDQFGAPVYGQSTRLPTYDVPDYNSGGYGMYGSSSQDQGQGIMNLPSIYIPPPGTIGSRSVAQLYNNSDMYSNLVPRRYADGGDVQHYAEGGVAETADIFKRVLGRDPTTAEFTKWQASFKDGMDAKKWTAFTEDPTIAKERTEYNVRMGDQRKATEDAQLAARTKVAQDKALKRSQGSGQKYANINAGLSSLAPENYPGEPVKLSDARKAAMETAFKGATTDSARARIMQENKFSPQEVAALTGTTFGDVNRRFATAQRQDAYAPMLQGQRFAMDQQAGVAASGQLPADISMYSGQDKAGLYRGLARQGMTDAQIRAAAENKYGMQSDADWKGLQDTVANPNLNTDRPRAVQQPVALPSYTNAGRQPTYDVTLDSHNRINNPNYGQGARTGAVDPYSNITNPGAGYTGPNLYAQALSIGMPSRDAALPAYQYTPLAPGATRQAPPASPTNSSTGDMARKQLQYQTLLSQGATDSQIRNAAETMFGVQTNADWNYLQGNYPSTQPRGPVRQQAAFNAGGIAGLAQGGYPRRNGQISGPGTEKSDSIPAMLSDGEFVMTAKAVRGAGKGSRRAGAKQMYKLMHQLEKNSERG
jgi:hypothetical protein